MCLAPTNRSIATIVQGVEWPFTVHTHALGLLWTFIRTDFKSRYHGTIGGFLWALLKPTAMFVVLLTVFSFVFSSDDQYNANLLIGLFLYDFFGESTKTGIVSLHAKGYLLTKARFPSSMLGGGVNGKRGHHSRNLRRCHRAV